MFSMISKLVLIVLFASALATEDSCADVTVPIATSRDNTGGEFYCSDVFQYIYGSSGQNGCTETMYHFRWGYAPLQSADWDIHNTTYAELCPVTFKDRCQTCATGLMKTYHYITVDNTCGEMTTCPQIVDMIDNVTMSLGTCALHGYSKTCGGTLDGIATPFYYDCKESRFDESQSDENRHETVYYFSDDSDCASGHLATVAGILQVTVTVTSVTDANKDAVCDAFAVAVNGTIKYCSLTGPNIGRRVLAESQLHMDMAVEDVETARTEMAKTNFIADSVTLPNPVIANNLSVTLKPVTYYTITEDDTCGEITTCPQIVNMIEMENMSMSQGTCAEHNYSKSCGGMLNGLATPFYYDCKESRFVDESQSDENRHAMVYYFSDDVDCQSLQVCEDVDGWSSACGHECVGYDSVDSDFTESEENEVQFVAECASKCTGDCTAFEWHRMSGCKFFTGTVLRQYLPPWGSDEQEHQEKSGCFQRVPDLEEVCSWSSGAPDVGAGWIVECGKFCKLNEEFDISDITSPFRMGVNMTECSDLCTAGDCDGFHWNPQNGGSCQLLSGTITGTQTDSIPSFVGGACVHKGIRDEVDSESSALMLSIFALTLFIMLFA